MAYRTADHLRTQSELFVVGIRIETSNNHPVKDMCDTLAGTYTKDFKFVGWHPCCRCHALKILNPPEEMREDTRRLLRGEQPLPPETSANYVAKPHAGFKRWIEQNAERIRKATDKGTAAYFLRDNEKYVRQAMDELEAENAGGADWIETMGEYQTSATITTTNPTPPHVEEYTSTHGGRVMISPRHGDNEKAENIRLAKSASDIMGETFYLLPRIDPSGKDAKQLRDEYLPKLVYKNKNPDFYGAGKLWEGKTIDSNNVKGDAKKIKTCIENHIRKAKKQADNFIIDVGDVDESVVAGVITNYLNRSHKDRTIIAINNGKEIIYKIQPGDT